MEATLIMVFLADHEWGNELMAKIADEVLEQHKDKPNLVVEVHEHAGWYLSYAMLDGERIIVGTANDQAKMSDKCRRFANRVKDAKWTYLPSVRRNNLTPA